MWYFVRRKERSHDQRPFGKSRFPLQVRVSWRFVGRALQGPLAHLLRVGVGVGAAPPPLPPRPHLLPDPHPPSPQPPVVSGASHLSLQKKRHSVDARAHGSSPADGWAPASVGRGRGRRRQAGSQHRAARRRLARHPPSVGLPGKSRPLWRDLVSNALQ